MVDMTVIPGFEMLVADAAALVQALPVESGRLRSRRLFRTLCTATRDQVVSAARATVRTRGGAGGS